MRPLIGLLALVLVPAVSAPSIARANQCDAGRPMLSNREIPLGCAVRAYLPTALAPVLEVDRGTRIDVTGTVTPIGAVDLPVHYESPNFDDQCNALTSVAPYTYQAYDLTFTATVGEILELNFSYYRTATVVTAGPCPEPEEYLTGSNWIQCSATVQEFQECYDQLCTPLASDTANCDGDGSNEPPPGDPMEDTGCATANGASGALGGAITVVLAAWIGCRRRRR